MGKASERLITNLKKAVTEMIFLSLFTMKPMSIQELQACLDEQDCSICKTVFPYSAINRLLDSNYIQEYGKRKAPDGRRRQHYKITKKGVAYLQNLRQHYEQFQYWIAHIFEFCDREKSQV